MFGKPNTLDRIALVIVASVALSSFANGLLMLVSAQMWYMLLLSSRFAGPFNQQLIQDVGLAYLTSSILLFYACLDLRFRWMAALAGTVWILSHGLLHIYQAVSEPGSSNLLYDSAGVLAAPVFVLIAVGSLMIRQRVSPAGIPKRLFLFAINKLTPGESGYMIEIANAPGRALEKVQHLMPATAHRFETSPEVFHMTRIAAALVEDCGPCALTSAQGALDDGVSKDLVNAALRADPPHGNLKLAFDFGTSIAEHSAQANDIGDEVEKIFGRIVRLELAMTAASVRFYPAMKRGLGLNKSCAASRLEI